MIPEHIAALLIADGVFIAGLFAVIRHFKNKTEGCGAVWYERSDSTGWYSIKKQCGDGCYCSNCCPHCSQIY